MMVVGLHFFLVLWIVNAGLAIFGKMFNLDSKLLIVEGDDYCGQLVCEAQAPVTSLILTGVKTTGAQDKFTVELVKSKPYIFVENPKARGAGNLNEQLANLSLNLLTTDVCSSYYFICEANYNSQSGQAHKNFAIIGPGNPPGLQIATQSIQEKPVEVQDTSSSRLKTDNPYLSELWFLGDKITKVEDKFETQSERLNRRLSENMDSVQRRAAALENSVLQRVGSVETDFSSRVSRLEDRVSSILLSQPPNVKSESGATQSLADLERRLDQVTETLDKINVTKLAAALDHQRQDNLPTVCERGMGDDVTKQYPRYVIMPHQTLGQDILCDTHTDGGGWIIFQRRAFGNVDFFRDWTAYKKGFGSVTGDFWMGNDALHALTDQHPYEVRLDMRHKGQEIFAEYSNFRIENEANKYKLELGPLQGTTAGTGGAFPYSNGMAFSTFDRDNDNHGTLNCATDQHGAWWYKSCHGSNFNGEWGVQATKGMSWNAGKTWFYLSFTEMKIRRTAGSTSP